MTVNAPKDSGKRMQALVEALADDAASASAKTLIEDAVANGVDIKAEGSRIRNVLLAGLQRARRDRYRHAGLEHQQALRTLEQRATTLPKSPAMQRQILNRFLEKKPQMREQVVTLQAREFESFSDADVESALRQLQHLGLLDDDHDLGTKGS